MDGIKSWYKLGHSILKEAQRRETLRFLGNLWKDNATPAIVSTVDQDAPTLTAVLLENPVLTRGKVGVEAGCNKRLSQMQREINELKEDVEKLKAEAQALRPGQLMFSSMCKRRRGS